MTSSEQKRSHVDGTASDARKADPIVPLRPQNRRHGTCDRTANAVTWDDDDDDDDGESTRALDDDETTDATELDSTTTTARERGRREVIVSNPWCRPRILYASTMVWLTCAGGRFLAPFLEHEASFSPRQIGATLALQQICIALCSPFGGRFADRLESARPGLGRPVVVGVGVLVSTAAFACHGLGALFSSSSYSFLSGATWHVSLQAVYGAGVSWVFSVLDGLTVDFLERRGEDPRSYGRERLHGPIWWAVANLALSPLLDRFGFAVCYPLAITTSALVAATLVVFVGAETTTTRRDSAFALVALRDRDHDHDEEDDDEEDDGQRIQRLPLTTLAGAMVASGCAFLLCLFGVASGQAIDDNLSFLFFEGLGSSFALLGLSIGVKILFEVPVFYHGERLLEAHGPERIMIVGCLLYAVRVWAYSYLPFGEVRYLLLLEPTHGVTYGATQIAMVDFAARSAPTGNEASAQGLINSLRELGGVLGVALGGWADGAIGPRSTYRVVATVVLVGAAVLGVDDARRRRRRDASAPPPRRLRRRRDAKPDDPKGATNTDARVVDSTTSTMC